MIVMVVMVVEVVMAMIVMVVTLFLGRVITKGHQVDRAIIVSPYLTQIIFKFNLQKTTYCITFQTKTR